MGKIQMSSSASMAVSTQAQVSKRRASQKKKPQRELAPVTKRLKKYWPLYVMLAPAIIYFAVISYLPMFGLQLAFKDYQFNKGIWGSPGIGWAHFRAFFMSFDAKRLILNTLRVGFLKCVVEFPFAIIFALILNEITNLRFRKINQTISYLPHFLSSVVVVTILQKVFAPNVGIINQLKGFFGADPSTFYLMESRYFVPLLFVMDLWKNIGWDSILYLSAMAAIDSALYEAAGIDGCNRFRKMLHVTLPGIRLTIGLLFILGIGGLLSSGVEQIYLLQTPGNKIVADTLDTWVLQMGLQRGQFGYATAIGLVQGVVGLLMVVSANYLCRKLTEVSLW